MRRILFSAGWYAAGLVTIPLLMWGVAAVEGRGVGFQMSSDVVWNPRSVNPPQHSACQSAAVQSSCGSHRSSTAMTDSLALDVSPFDDADFPASPVEVAQNRTTLAAPENDVFAGEPEVRPFGLPVPQPDPAVLTVILPVTPEMLASGIPKDEAETAKLTELRETLKKVVDEKAAMLSATALEMEIALHQRHLADLMALQELLKLQQSLKELSDKYPNSNAGRRAGQMLQQLTQPQLRSLAPDYAPSKRQNQGQSFGE